MGIRTDVKVDTKREIRLPKIPVGLAAIPSYAKAGTWIEWKTDGNTCRGRVIGIVKCPDDGKEYLCTAMVMLGGCICERWVDPEIVYDSSIGSDCFEQKSSWIHGDAFLRTNTDHARNAFHMLVSEMEISQCTE